MATTATETAPAPASKTMMPIRLTTRTPRHAIPDSQYMVPSDWRRFQLSELINTVLENAQPVPFDFVVDEELLRTSLAGYMRSKGLSEETVLELEYVESILPPKFVSAFEHDDWVSDVDVSRPGLFLTASYTSTLSLFSSTAQLLHSFTGHSQPALSACWVGAPLPSGSSRIASCGMDRVVRVWDVPSASNDEDPTVPAPAPKTVYQLPLHTAPVASVRSSALSTPTPRVLTAGWDGLVALWSLDDNAATSADAEVDDSSAADRSRKRRRKGAAASEDGLRLAPVHVLKGHSGTVSRAIFDRADASKAYSAGWDHSVRTWDLEVGTQLDSRSSDKVLLALDQMSSANLLVTGAADRTVCFWDLRQATSTISITMQGHTSHVTSVRAHPTSPLLVVSASHDSTVKVWDARSPKQALFSVRRRADPKALPGAPGGKVLCVDWDGELIAAGGEDGKLELHRANVSTGTGANVAQNGATTE